MSPRSGKEVLRIVEYGVGNFSVQRGEEVVGLLSKYKAVRLMKMVDSSPDQPLSELWRQLKAQLRSSRPQRIDSSVPFVIYPTYYGG